MENNQQKLDRLAAEYFKDLTNPEMVRVSQERDLEIVKEMREKYGRKHN